MTFENRMRMAEHYLSLDENGKKRQKHLASFVPEYQAFKGKEAVDIDYSSMTKAQLKTACDGAEISYGASATKDELISLLEAKSNEEPQEEEEEEEEEQEEEQEEGEE